MAELRPLPPTPSAPAKTTQFAWRLLNAAHADVEGVLTAHRATSSSRRSTNADARGRPTRHDENLLRAAVVFTSAGIDAAMKRLVNDAGRYLITRSPTSGARKQFEQFIQQELGGQRGVSSDLRSAIIHQNATDEVVRYYLTTRTRASFQGSSDLRSRVKSVLGLPNARVSDTDLEKLDPFFLARNSIAHALDFAAPSSSRSTARVRRSAPDVVALCDQAFETAALLIHATSDVVRLAK